MVKKYEVKTYFQKDKQDFSNYILEMIYATLLPAFCVVMARDFKEFFWVATTFWLFFITLLFLQVRVKIIDR